MLPCLALTTPLSHADSGELRERAPRLAGVLPVSRSEVCFQRVLGVSVILRAGWVFIFPFSTVTTGKVKTLPRCRELSDTDREVTSRLTPMLLTRDAPEDSNEPFESLF